MSEVDRMGIPARALWRCLGTPYDEPGPDDPCSTVATSPAAAARDA